MHSNQTVPNRKKEKQQIHDIYIFKIHKWIYVRDGVIENNDRMKSKKKYGAFDGFVR